MLTIACVCVPGGIYTSDHVIRLANMVVANTTQPATFVVIDHSEWPGWWAKLDLFEPNRFEGRVLYLDLDTTVVGPLDDLANYPAPFAAINDWGRPCLNSSVMVWDAGVADHIYDNFRPEIVGRDGGDQLWITEQMPDAATFPPDWCPSFKHQCHFGPPKDARVIVSHGQPKPWDLRKGHWLNASRPAFN